MAKTGIKLPPFGTTVAALWMSLVRDVFDPYRPELHYMRGPGPKWRAKHAFAAAPAHTPLPGLAEASA